MVERVVRAMIAGKSWVKQDFRGPKTVITFDDLPKSYQDKCRAEARLAIQAMRDPTGAMIAAGERVMLDNNEQAGYELRIWHAMIDAALD